MGGGSGGLSCCQYAFKWPHLGGKSKGELKGGWATEGNLTVITVRGEANQQKAVHPLGEREREDSTVTRVLGNLLESLHF